MGPIYLFGHCVFCLRKETRTNQIPAEKFIGAVTSSIPLEITNQVTKHFLTAIGREGWEGFVEPPTICSICACHVRRINQLLKDLSEATSAIQTAIKWAGFEGRVGDFLTKLRASSGNVAVKRSTVKFLLQLGHLEIQQEESQPGNNVASEDNDPSELKKGDQLCEEENQEFQGIDEPGVEYSDDAGDSDDDYVEEEEAGSSQSDSDSEKPVQSENPSDANNGEVPRASYRGKRVQCDYCHERIPEMDLRCHLRTHVGDFAVECPNPSCYWAYTTTAKLKSHLKQCNAKGQEGSSSSSAVNLDICQLCGFEALSQPSLRNHLVNIHESATSKELHCPFANCTEEFTHRQTVLCHINQKHSQRPEPSPVKKGVSTLLQKCPDSDCNKNNRNGSMSQHLVDDHGIPAESLVSCKYCPFVYLDHQNLVDHLCLHVKNSGAVSCHICTEQEIKFAGMRDLRQHYFDIHQVGELHRCQHCDNKSSLSLLDITSHIRTVHKLDRNGKPIHGVKCDLCPEHVTREYFDPKVLLKHKINEHGAEPFRCQFCDKTFSLQSRCHEHELEHKGIVKPKLGPFKCDIHGCGKEFSSRRTLSNHKKSILHMGKTNTELCVECGKWFSNKKSLYVHMRIEHATEKILFVCDQCGAKFKTKGNLKQHTEGVHNNPSHRECHMCKRRFQKKTALARHLAHLKPDGTCLGEKNFRYDWRKRRQEKLDRERAS